MTPAIQDEYRARATYAKVLVDRVSRTHGPKREVISFKDESSSTGRILASLVAVMVLATAYFFYIGI